MNNNNKSIWRKILPHAVALVVFAAVSALFFAPQFEGKALRQSDMVHAQGMSQDIKEHIEKYDEHPQWAGRMFGGMPAYLINMNYEGRWVKNIADNFYILGQPASFLFLAMAGFYLMLLLMGVNPWIAIIGGLGYGLSTYFPIIIMAGHLTKMIAMIWVAPMIGAVWYAYRKNRWVGAVLAGIFGSLEIAANHYQITYYFLFVLLALVINEFIRSYKQKILSKFAVTTVVLFGAAVLAVGSNFSQLYYIQTHSEVTMRGGSELSQVADNNSSGLDKDYALAWSYGKAETLNLFIPNFMGGSSSHGFSDYGDVAESLDKYQARDYATHLPGYWGDQSFTEGPVYLGAVMVFLFVFGLFYLPGRQKWWLVAVTVLAIMLAWGKNMMWLSSFFLDYFPMYDKFRTVSTILVIVQWSVPLLGMLALQNVYQRTTTKEHFNKSFKYSVIITGGLALFIAIIGPMALSFEGPSDTALGMPDDVIAAMQSERASLLRADAFRSLIFVALAAAALWLWANEKIKYGWAIASLALFTTMDLYAVDRRFVSIDDFQPARKAKEIAKTSADEQILRDESNYRVINFVTPRGPFNDATTSYFHRSAGGYHAVKLRRYQDVIEHHLSQQNMAVYDMLNTKYFITPDKDRNPVVQVNPGALGNAWFVSGVKLVENPDEELASLGENFNPAQTAVVDQKFESQVDGIVPGIDSTASITLADYKVNHLTYRSNNSARAIAIFSEIYYDKGWKAYIDGVEAPYFRADYVLRAMVIPAGEHTIEWRFAAPKFKEVTTVTKASSLILLLGALGIIVSAILKQRRKEAYEE